MKIWFEGDILYYDLEYLGVSPQFIKQPGYMITEAELNGTDLFVRTPQGNYTIKDIDDPKITKVIFD